MFFLFLTVQESEQEEIMSRLKKIKNGCMEEREQFIKDYTPFISKNASQIVGKYINSSDSDEFSEALMAFNQAIDSFDIQRNTAFIPFAKLIIKRRLIDYLRKQQKNGQEVSFSQLEDEDGYTAEEKLVSTDKYEEGDAVARRQEIEKFAQMLKKFKISFEDLVNDSPSHKDTRTLCFSISRQIVRDEEMVGELFSKGVLPVKRLAEICGISRKTLERHRKYIIAISIILSGDYENIKKYISGM